MTISLDPYPGGPLARTAAALFRSLKGRSTGSQAAPQKTVSSKAEFLISARLDLPAGSAHLREIFAGCEAFPGLAVFVHGSWADDTRTDFSDLDDFLVIDRQRFDGRSAGSLIRWLNRVDMRMCRIDPLQHHGYWIAYKEQLADYDASQMPPAALNGAICLCGDPEILFMVSEQDSQAGYRRVLSGLLRNIELFAPKYFARDINLYEMKGFVSSILLIPALIMQIGGETVDKRSAILAAPQILPPAAAHVVATCSAIRNSWGAQLTGIEFALFHACAKFFFNPHLFRRFAARFSPRYRFEDTVFSREHLEGLKATIRFALDSRS